jgi:hypothetical protein
VKVFRTKAIPIAIGSPKEQRDLERIVGCLESLELGEQRRKQHENELNALVNTIYGLSPDDVEAIRTDV